MRWNQIRKPLVIVLMLTLALPAWTLHFCRCARAGDGKITAEKTALKSTVSLRPCCAKRLAGAAKSKPGKPELRRHCCCGEIRWNQTASRVIPERVTAPSPDSMISMDASANLTAYRAESDPFLTMAEQVRAGPGISRLLLHCRFLI